MTLRDIAIFVIVLVVIVSSISVPVQFRWFWPLIKQFKMFGRKINGQNMESTERDRLSELVGNIGSDKRKKYGAVGSPINIAFRVESLTGEGEVLVTPAVYNRIDCLKLGEVRETTLKGFDKPIALRQVISY